MSVASRCIAAHQVVKMLVRSKENEDGNSEVQAEGRESWVLCGAEVEPKESIRLPKLVAQKDLNMSDVATPSTRASTGGQLTPNLREGSSQMMCSSSSGSLSGGGFHSAVQIMGMLGRGSFAQVYAARHGNRPLAVKISEIGRAGASPSGHQFVSLTAVNREVDILMMASGLQNCVTTYGAFLEDGMSYIVMEFCDRTTLSFFESKATIDVQIVWLFFKQVFQSLVAIHAVGIIHRDVKPDNFLLCTPRAKGAASTDFTLKLSDFGLSAVRGKHSLSCCFGTAPFMSPEMVGTFSHEENTDVWSAGAVMYTFFFGRFPCKAKFPNAASMKEAIRSGVPATTWNTSSDSQQPAPPAIAAAIPLIKLLLCRDAALRPQAKEVLRCKWFTSSSSQLDKHDFSRLFHKTKTAGLFDVRNMQCAEEKKELTPFEQTLTNLQQECFPRTASFCMQPFKKVLAMCRYEEALRKNQSEGESTCSTHTPGSKASVIIAPTRSLE